MKLFAAIAATTMISQATDKIVMDDEPVNVAIIYKDGEEVCLTEQQLKKVQVVHDTFDIVTEEKDSKKCGKLKALNWARYFEPTTNEDGTVKKAPVNVPWTEARKAFAFLTSPDTVDQVAAQHWSIPKPMTSPFNDMKLQENKVEKVTEEVEEGGKMETRHVDKVTKTGEVVVPAAIKNFFAFQVDASPANEEARIEAIKERNENNENEVAGQYGSIHLKDQGVNDKYLNQDQGVQYFSRDYKVNNPRELIQMIEAANALNYQELLNFASAKLASGIRMNDLWRLRAILGFTPTGDYTNKTYKVVQKDKDDETVAGYFSLLEDNAWFVPEKDQHADFKADGTVTDEYLPGDALNKQYTDINNVQAMRVIMDRDYPAGWISVKDKTDNEICTKNALIN